MTERRYGGPNGYGHVPDPAGHMRTSARRLIGTHAPTDTADLTGFAPPVMDQGPTSSCVGHAFACAIFIALRKAGVAVELPSPAWLYKVGLCIDRTYNGRGKPAPILDEGSMPNQVERGIDEFGMLDATDYPLDLETLLEEPTLFEFERASLKCMVGWGGIDTTGTEREDDISRTLDSGRPYVFAVDADRPLEDNTGETLGPLVGPSLGGHMLCGLAVKRLTASRRRYKFQNSWTRNWGADGFGYGDERFVARMSDILVPSVQIVRLS